MILVVDDDSDIREIVGDILAEKGHVVASADNGAKALALVQRKCPDVILLDLRMPVMDGVTFLAELRANTDCRSTKVIVMSAYTDMQTRDLDDVEGFLRKPFAMADLLAKVAATLAKEQP